MKSYITKLNRERDKVLKFDTEKQAEGYCKRIKPLMDTVRDHADALESIVDNEDWPLPKMREILFTR